mgnify:CR=1 FL=1
MLGASCDVVLNLTTIIPEPQITYNSEVVTVHTCAVGLNQVWVHNTCKTKAIKASPKPKTEDTININDYSQRIDFVNLSLNFLIPRN